MKRTVFVKYFRFLHDFKAYAEWELKIKMFLLSDLNVAGDCEKIILRIFEG